MDMTLSLFEGFSRINRVRFEKMNYEPHQKGDILLISGIGKVYPFMRSHKILDNIQHIFSDIPVLMLYPGKFDGQDLDLFDRFLDGHYYRAFNLL